MTEEHLTAIGEVLTTLPVFHMRINLAPAASDQEFLRQIDVAAKVINICGKWRDFLCLEEVSNF